MRVTTGKVVDGKVVVDGEPVVEGQTVTVVVQEDEETFDLTDEEVESLARGVTLPAPR